MMKKMLCIATVAAAVAAVAEEAVEDCIIGTGETLVVSGVREFGNLECDGLLKIADGSTITFTTFVAGTEAGKTGTVEIGNNVQVTITSKGKEDFIVGRNGASAYLTVGTNSVVTCGGNFNVRRFDEAYANAVSANPSLIDETSQVSVHLKDNATVQAANPDTVVYFSGGTKLTSSTPAKFVGNHLRLDKGSVFNFCCFNLNCRPHTRVLFNGGELRQGLWNNSNTSMFMAGIGWYHKVTDATMYLTGTNGNDIALTKSSWSISVFATSNGGGKFLFDGDGDVVLTGIGNNATTLNQNGNLLWCNLLKERDITADMVKFGGKTVRLEGLLYLKVAYGDSTAGSSTILERLTGVMSSFTVLKTGPQVSLDLAGTDMAAATLEAEGPVFSSLNKRYSSDDENAVPDEPVGVVFGKGNADCFLGNMGTNVVFRKIGTGALSISNAADVAALNVTTGAVTFTETAAGDGAVSFDRLELGESVSLSLGGGRSLAVGELCMDSSSTADVDVFAPAAGGSLELKNASYGSYPTSLAFKVGSVMDKSNLSGWSLYFDGILKGAIGAADPVIGVHDGYLTLGRFGLKMIIR